MEARHGRDRTLWKEKDIFEAMDIDETTGSEALGWADRIEEAHERIKPLIVRTELDLAPDVAPSFGGKLGFKLEQRQQTGSFKLRGAANRIAVLTPSEAAAGVTTSSMGNHGLGVAFAAREAGVPVEVFVSPHVSADRLERMRALDAVLRVVGTSVLDAEVAARRAARESGKVYISPYNDPDVVAGQGTIGLELLQQAPDLDAVFVAVGGGGLIGGIGAYLKARAPDVEVVGCWPENAPALHECLRRGRIVEVPERPTLSESTAGGIEDGSITFDLAKDVVDRSVMVSEEEILTAMRLLRERRDWWVEGSAGVALAAFMRHREEYDGRTVAVVLCGGNISPEVRALIAG
ncbi:MAG: threonine/serine dehydratase [Gemmatimonadota bacterium]